MLKMLKFIPIFVAQVIQKQILFQQRYNCKIVSQVQQ